MSIGTKNTVSLYDSVARIRRISVGLRWPPSLSGMIQFHGEGAERFADTSTREARLRTKGRPFKTEGILGNHLPARKETAMNLPKICSITHLDELRREVDRLFENYVGSTPGDLLRGKRFPAIDVWEDGQSLFVQAAIPGVAMEHIEVYARGNELTLKGTRPSPCAQSTGILRQEQQTGDFDRTIPLPVEVDPERIEATLKDGLLTIHVPKPPLSQARKVPVHGQEIAENG